MNQNNCKNKANDLNLAIAQVENYITRLNPKNYSDIKQATYDISKAAIGAFSAVHSVNETLNFINQLAHVVLDDVTSEINVPKEYLTNTH